MEFLESPSESPFGLPEPDGRRRGRQKATCIMADSTDTFDPDKATGSQLRQKLEEALRENRQLRDLAVTTTAERVITQTGLSLVKPEDLAGVPLADIEDKAKQLQAERETQAQELIRAQLSAKGLAAEDVEAQLAVVFGEAQPDPEAEAWSRARSASAIAGTRAAAVNPDMLSPREKLRLGVEAARRS